MASLREIKTHRCDELGGDAVATTLNDKISLWADETSRGHGLAPTVYHADLSSCNVSVNPGDGPVRAGSGVTFSFQGRPIPESGVPEGLSNEVLLAIVLDRLQCFQNGPFNGRENAEAISHLMKALNWLHRRTRDRAVRGVEGKLEK